MPDVATYVPQFILRQYESETYAGAFDAVGLFVDISGFSAVTSTLVAQGSEAAEDMATIMSAIWEPVVDAVIEQGGIVAGFAGDALTALFPIEEQNAAEEVARRALWSAHLIQKNFAQHPTQPSRYGTFSFAIKLGMDVGRSEWGIIRSDAGGASFYFSGPVVDGAAAAEHQAEEGFLVLSERIAHHLADVVRRQALEQGYSRVLLMQLDKAPPYQVAAPFTAQPATYDMFVPDAIQSKAERGEFRSIISVFINVKGVDTHTQLDRFMQAIYAVQQRYGGTISGIDFGDKGCNVLMFWGMPTAYPNDMDRALSFLLDLAQLTPVTFKAGVTLRTMYAGFAGSSKRGEYTCYGTGVNLAARLMVAAPWGEVWLEARIAAQAADQYTLAERGEHAFKGFDEPQPAHALISRNSKSAVFQGVMAGREPELKRIDTFLTPLWSGNSPGMLIVDANAGMGKSRLVYEARHLLHLDQQATIGLGQTDELVSIPMGPFRYWLSHTFDQSPTYSDKTNKQRFNSKLSGLTTELEDSFIVRELDRLRSCLGALVGLHWPNSLYEELDPEARHNTSLLALRYFIQALCLQKPLILIVEDLHWLDVESKQFVEFILLAMEEHPFAILATQRPTTIDWAANLTIETITLNALTLDDLARIAENILDGPAHASLLALLEERSEGNPFFAEQIVRYLTETEGIIHTEEGWRLVAESAEVSLPADIRSLFTARLDALTAEVKNVVQTASILGREFEVRLLSRMLKDDVDTQVETASEEAIWMALDELHYMFQHALLRDAAYHMQLQARRRELHHLAANALKSLYQGDMGEVIDTVAYHLKAAVEQGLDALRGEAVEALMRAAQHAATAFENKAAEQHYSDAIALLDDQNDPLLIELLLGREAMRKLNGNLEGQDEDITQLEALTAGDGPTEQRLEIAMRRIHWLETDAQREAVIAACAAAIDMARQLNLLAPEAQILVRMADSYRELAMPDMATNELEKAMELAEAIDESTIRADALNAMSFLYLNQGGGAKAVKAQRQALAIYDAIDNTVGQLRVLKMLGFTYRYLGEFEDCIDTYARALKIAEQRGDAAGCADALHGLSNIYTDIGQLEQARHYAKRAHAIMRELRNAMSLFHVEVFEGFLSLLDTDYAQAVNHLSKALELAQGTQAQMPAALAESYLGEALTGLGRWAEALACYEAARRTIEGHNIQDLVIENHIRSAVVYISMGQPTAAREHMAHVEAFLAGGRHLAETEYPVQLHLLMAQIYATLEEAAQARHFADVAIADLLMYRDKLSNSEYRKSFVENLPWNNKVLTLHEAKQVGKDILPLLAFDNLQQPPAPQATPPLPVSENVEQTETLSRPMPTANVDLQTALARIAYLEGRIDTLEQLRQEDRKALADLNRALGRAEALIEQLKQGG